MDITIIGTGNMARGIATRALAGGHTVTLLGTSTERPRRSPPSWPATCAPARSATRSPATSSCSPSGTRRSTTCSHATATSSTARSSSTSPTRSTPRPTRRSPRGGLGRPGDRRARPGREGRQGVQHDIRRHARRGQVAGQPLDVFIASDDEDAKDSRPAARRRRRPARDRRRPAGARASARGARLPQHGHPARPRHQLRQRGQGPRLARGPTTDSAPAAGGRGERAISTYDTDFVLVRARALAAAIEALQTAGHEVSA